MVVHAPVDRNGEDGVDVAQHCFEMLRILLEAHLCQDQRLADVWNGKVQRGGEEGVGSEGTGVVLAPPAGAHTCWLTFLSGHVDTLAVAEGAPASARRVHFILHAAVNDPELDLRWGRRASSLSRRVSSLTTHV